MVLVLLYGVVHSNKVGTTGGAFSFKPCCLLRSGYPLSTSTTQGTRERPLAIMRPASPLLRDCFENRSRVLYQRPITEAGTARFFIVQSHGSKSEHIAKHKCLRFCMYQGTHHVQRKTGDLEWLLDTLQHVADANPDNKAKSWQRDGGSQDFNDHQGPVGAYAWEVFDRWWLWIGPWWCGGPVLSATDVNPRRRSGHTKSRGPSIHLSVYSNPRREYCDMKHGMYIQYNMCYSRAPVASLHRARSPPSSVITVGFF